MKIFLKYQIFSNTIFNFCFLKKSLYIAWACFRNVQSLFTGDCTTFTLRLATKARSFSIGPLHPSFKIEKILQDAMRETLPDNAHELATGRLFISLTRVTDRKNVVVSEYDSKEELIQVQYTGYYCKFGNFHVTFISQIFNIGVINF